MCVIVWCRTWKWRDYNIRYQRAGDSGPALVLIHGFGANWWVHDPCFRDQFNARSHLEHSFRERYLNGLGWLNLAVTTGGKTFQRWQSRTECMPLIFWAMGFPTSPAHEPCHPTRSTRLRHGAGKSWTSYLMLSTTGRFSFAIPLEVTILLRLDSSIFFH